MRGEDHREVVVRNLSYWGGGICSCGMCDRSREREAQEEENKIDAASIGVRKAPAFLLGADTVRGRRAGIAYYSLDLFN